MRGILGRGVQRSLDHLRDLRIAHRARAACPILVSQPFNAGLRKTTTPFANRVLVNPEPERAAPVLAPASALPPGWSPAVRQRLQARYGSLAASWCAQAPAEALQRIAGTHTLWLELPLAARHEAVQHLDDLLLRRTRLGLLLPQGAQALLPQVRQLCAPHLDWSAARWAEETARYQALVAAHYQLPNWNKNSL